MNSIQLISKINSRIEDLAMLSHEVLKPNTNLSNIEKEVIKRSCSDLYELILKLSIATDVDEERSILKENISQELKKEENSFKEILSNNVTDEITINELADISNIEIDEKIEILEEENNIFYEAIVEEVVHETKIESTTATNHIFDFEVFSESVIETPLLTPESIETISKIDETIISTIENLNEQIEKEKILDTNKVEPTSYIIEPDEKPASFISIGKTILPQNQPSLNEKIAQKIESFQFSEKIIEPKIESLKTAISLNKKIAFVNDLFKENVVEYAKSIDKINNAVDLNEAMFIWTELKITHKWDLENSLVKDLEKLIQRRFN
jgi:hypothetical protein